MKARHFKIKMLPKTITKLVLMILIFFLKNSFNWVQASTGFAKNHIHTLLNSSLFNASFNASKTIVKHHMNSIQASILKESQKYNLDPIMLLSIIKIESNFSIHKHGKHGEIGLMQIKPSTGKWIAKKNGLTWKGPKTLEDPASNIQIGAAYLSFLKDQFSSRQPLYLAAYNMGIGNVRKAIQRKVIPRDYAHRVMCEYHSYYALFDRKSKALSL
jgi:soluble lytic murein transglycosylase-like protein